MFAHFLHFHFFKNNKNWILEVFFAKRELHKIFNDMQGVDEFKFG